MLHAAAMLCVLAIIWMALTQQWSSAQDWAAAAGAGAVCVLFSWRFGGASAAFARAPQMLLLTLSRLGIVFRGALATIRAAVSADVRLKPALVRIKTRLADPSQLAAMAGTVTAAPGSAAVEVDSDGMLVHVINEDAVDADDLGRIEARVGARGSAS